MMHARRTGLIAATLLLGTCLPTSAARAEQPGQEPPFGHTTGWLDPREAGEPIPLDIEVERDGRYFWRGQIDGRSGEITLQTPMDVCPLIIVTGASPGDDQAEYDNPRTAELKLSMRFIPYEDQPQRFEMTFSYARPVGAANAAGGECGNGVELRTVTLSPTFVLAPGEATVLQEYAGFRIRVARK